MLTTAALLVLFVANGASASAALALGLLIGLFANGCVAGFMPCRRWSTTHRCAHRRGVGHRHRAYGRIIVALVAVLLDGGGSRRIVWGVCQCVRAGGGCLLLRTRPAPVAVSDALSH